MKRSILVLFIFCTTTFSLCALNLRFKKVFQTEDSLLIGEIKVLYSKKVNFAEYDSLIYDFTSNSQVSDELKFDFLNVKRFEKYFFRLKIQFEDTIRESNNFKANTKFSNYTIYIRNKDLYIENTTPFFKTYHFEIIESFASVIIFVLKLLSAFLLMKILKYPIKLFRYLLLTNLLLIPLLYYAFPLFLPETLKYYLIPETIILLLETTAVYFLIRKELGFRKILFLNTYTNLIGYIIYNLIVAVPFVL